MMWKNVDFLPLQKEMERMQKMEHTLFQRHSLRYLIVLTSRFDCQNLMIELTKPRTDLDNWFSFCEDATTQSYFITDRMVSDWRDSLISRDSGEL